MYDDLGRFQKFQDIFGLIFGDVLPWNHTGNFDF